MKLEWQIGFWIGAFLLSALLLWLFSDVLLPFAAALAIAYLLNPVVDLLEKLGFNRLGATLLILALLTLGVALGSILILPILWRQFTHFIDTIPAYASKLQGLISAETERLAREYGGMLSERLGLGWKGGDFSTTANDLITQAAHWAAAFLNSLVTRGAALISLMSLLVVTPVVAFYILLDWERMLVTIDGLVPLRHQATVRGLAREIDRALAGFLRGQALVCLFLGLWYGIGLSLVGLDFGLLIGLSSGVLSFIPYVGSLSALLVASTVAILQDWPKWNLLALSLAVVLTGQFLEGNILSPKLVGESIGLHPVWLIFALLAFGSLFGFTGLITAVPFAAAAGVIFRFAVERYRESDLYLGTSGPSHQTLLDSSRKEEERER